MENTIRREFEQVLRRRRRELVREAAGREMALRTIAEDHESELEERAQDEQVRRLLARLNDRERDEVTEIDAALDRIADGTYGRCARCDRAIEIDRLMVLPEAAHCVHCAVATEGPMPEEA